MTMRPGLGVGQFFQHSRPFCDNIPFAGDKAGILRSFCQAEASSRHRRLFSLLSSREHLDANFADLRRASGSGGAIRRMRFSILAKSMMLDRATRLCAMSRRWHGQAVQTPLWRGRNRQQGRPSKAWVGCSWTPVRPRFNRRSSPSAQRSTATAKENRIGDGAQPADRGASRLVSRRYQQRLAL